MSDSPLNSLPVEVRQTLERLRAKIRQYVFWEGAALVLVVLGGLFWGSFLVDAIYFALSRWELPRWFRATVLVAGLAALAAVAVLWIGLRLGTVLRARALALLLERRFPQLGDRLITAVEAAERSEVDTPPFHRAMLERTLLDAAQTTDRLDLSLVFNQRPLRRAVVISAVLIASILGLAVVDSSAMDRWWSGFVGLQDSYWPRQTQLAVKVLTQPGDRIREFVDGRYRHPRGGDLTLLVESTGPQKPDRVRLDYRLASGGLRRTYLAPQGDQPLQQTFPVLLESVRLWVRGGDYASPRPLIVEVVDPPRIDSLQLDVIYPDYTGLNTTDDADQVQPTRVPVQGTQASVPLGSQVVLSGRSNKPLRGARIEFEVAAERFVLEFGENSAPGDSQEATMSAAAWLTQRSREGQTELRCAWTSPQMPLLDADGLGFRVPLVLTAPATANLGELVAAAASGQAALPPVLPWPADVASRITLEDRDGIGSPEPTRVTLLGIVDQPPVVEVQLKGVSQAITRQARIPVQGMIRDDYGVREVRFEFQVDQLPEWQPRDLQSPLKESTREFPLARTIDQPFERFDVLPLDLSTGQKLRLTVVAVDGNTLAGPQRQRSQPFVFQVVPTEELLSLLFAKEVNLRNRFEQILAELKELRQDLTLHRERASEARSLRSQGVDEQDERLRQPLLSLSASAERGLHNIRKNATETTSIAEAFREIRDELVNNAADTPQNMDRLETEILQPLERITEADYSAVDGALGLFKLANDKRQDAGPAIATAEQELAGLIERMERVLLEMRKLETFQESLELLKSIFGAQDGVYKDTKTERKAKALEALESK